MPARGCRAGFQLLSPLSSRAYLINASSATMALRAAALGKSGICKCTAAIRANAGLLAFNAEATAARPGMIRSTAHPCGNAYMSKRAIYDKTAAAPFDQRRAAKQQTIVGASEPKIVRRVLAQPPNRINHDRPYNKDENDCLATKVNNTVTLDLL
jgi:hypothetical protein